MEVKNGSLRKSFRGIPVRMADVEIGDRVKVVYKRSKIFRTDYVYSIKKI